MPTLITTFFLILTASNLFSQTPSLSHFSKWGLHAGMAVYEKGITSANAYFPSIEHKNGTSFYINVSRVSKIADRLNFETGLNILQPTAAKYTFKMPDPYGNGLGLNGLIVHSKTIKTFEIPFILNYELPISRKQLISYGIGFSMLYMPNGEAELTSSMLDSNNIQIEYFGLKADTPPFPFSSSLQFLMGYHFCSKKILYSAKLRYSYKFTPLMTGQYLYDNLTNVPRTEGTYKISGSYVALTFGINLIRKDGKYRYN